jgi:hypothetical protein
MASSHLYKVCMTLPVRWTGQPADFSKQLRSAALLSGPVLYKSCDTQARLTPLCSKADCCDPYGRHAPALLKQLRSHLLCAAKAIVGGNSVRIIA